jgi:hypothetical protein
MTAPVRHICTVAMIASAFALSTSAIVATGADAGARGTPPDPSVTCTLSGTFEFGLGITQQGFVGFPSLMLLENDTIGGCTGNGAPNDLGIGVKCDKHVAGIPATNPVCEPKLVGFNSWANVVDGTWAAGIQKETKGHFGFSFNINGKLYYARTTSATTILSGGVCGGSEIGFQMVAKVNTPRNDKRQTMTVTDCLDTITGTGLTPGDNFYDTSIDQVGLVSTAAIDPATSSVHIG